MLKAGLEGADSLEIGTTCNLDGEELCADDLWDTLIGNIDGGCEDWIDEMGDTLDTTDDELKVGVAVL